MNVCMNDISTFFVSDKSKVISREGHRAMTCMNERDTFRNPNLFVKFIRTLKMSL